MPERPPPDAAQRARITAELDATLFVEAGAGSGKTSSLVDRIVALVTVAGVPMAEIAAITFTEKAAAELRERVRRRLEEAVPAAPDELTRLRLEEALRQLDGAAVSTLHAFAQRLLTELPVQAGLPPRVEVADELSSQLAFDERWAGFVDALLDERRLRADPAEEDALFLLLEINRPLERLRDVALEFERNWDLVATHIEPTPPPPLAVADTGRLVDELRAVARERFHGNNDEDTLVRALAELEDAAAALAAAKSVPEQRRVLGRICAAGVKGGNKVNFRGGPYHDDLDPLRKQAAAAIAPCQELFERQGDAATRRLVHHIGRFTLETAAERRRTGRLAFHDLLVLARELLRDPERGPDARRILHERYTRLLLDEFQDTDPIQVDIASLLAADPAAPLPSEGLPPSLPGRLFFVGDPKQSIYRFRRADIATFLATRDEVTDDPVQLTANFRTTEPIVAWVNAVFEQLIVETPGAQPAYQPLQAVRTTALAGPPVVAFGRAHEDDPRADELRRREVVDVVELVHQALAGWEVEDDGVVRPAGAGDIAILIPSRLVLDVLEDGLDGADLPYRTESSSLAYASREIRDLLLAVRAIDDPSDELALVSALRSPLFGCSDADLYRWKVERGGSWSLVGAQRTVAEPDDPVGDALDYLRARVQERGWIAPAELLDRLVRDRRVLELAGGGRRARDVWRRVRYVVDQARAWRDAGGGSLRAYVDWAHRQASDSVRVTEAVLPETDHDAVRIMTIHAAKGLEFPIVIVAGLTTQIGGGGRSARVRWRPDGPEVRLDQTVVTTEFELQRALDEQLDEHEQRRLLYVACTRARDHLAVSVHRNAKRKRTLAQLLGDASGGLALHEVLAPAEAGEAGEAGEPGDRGDGGRRAAAPTTSATPATPTTGVTELAFDLSTWPQEQAALLATASRSRTVGATSLDPHGAADLRVADDPGLAKGAVDLDRPPWQKGRYGTAIGRAVHAVLQTVDLATGDGVDEAAAAQAASEGVIGREHTIAALARSALASAVVAEAVAAPERWREVFVAAPFGDTLLEGYLDLLYRGDQGLVVVDYKTDQPRDDADLGERVARYRLQLAAYAAAVERVTGEAVARAVLVFCSADPSTPATEREVPALRAAVDEVVQRLASHRTGTPPPQLV